MATKYSLSLVWLRRVVVALGLVAAALVVSGPASFAATCQTVQTPNVRAGDNSLRAVTVTSSRNAWAVGSYSNPTGAYPLVEHWDGRSWSVQASPKLSGELSGVAATSSTNVWAVGQSGLHRTRTLALHCG